MTENDKVIVVFRYDKEADEVIALFPFIHDSNGLVSSFVHVGQHGGADYQYTIQKTKPATAEQYANLKRELEAPPYRYNLLVRKKAIPQHRHR